MRIRLRVPRDGEQESTGLRAWVQRFFGSASTADAADTPASPAAKPDKRWSVRGKARYCPVGRLCVHFGGNWQAEYLFEVQSRGEKQQIRVILPEADIAKWEKSHGNRMPESQRLRLARETLEALLDRDRVPSAITVSALEIENTKL